MPDAYLLIGEITKPQGVRGELKVRPITCDPDRFLDLETVYLRKGNDYTPCHIAVRSAGDEAVFMRMDGVVTREDAEKMRGTQLYIDREHAVDLDENSNFLVDLIGCEAVDEEGTVYGKITDVLQPGGNDVYVIAGKNGEILVPALRIVVTNVDIESKRMLLNKQHLMETAVFPDSEEIR